MSGERGETESVEKGEPTGVTVSVSSLLEDGNGECEEMEVEASPATKQKKVKGKTKGKGRHKRKGRMH